MVGVNLDHRSLALGDLLTVAEVAALLKAKVKTIRQWVYQGKIPCLKINGLLRFSKLGLESWIAEQAGGRR